MQRSARSGTVQPVMRSLRRNHGRRHANIQDEKTRETVRAELPGGAPDGRRSGRKEAEPSTVDRQQSPREPGTSEKPPVTEGISPKSRGDERTESPEYRMGGKTAPVTARWGELSRVGRREAVAGPAGGIPEQRYEG